MALSKKAEKVYGPIDLPGQTCCLLLDIQRETLWKNYHLGVTITSHMPKGNLGRVTVHEALPVCFG